MADRKQDIQVKFKAILDKLPPDKKKELYNRLVKMDSEERNRTIESIVKSSEAKNAQKKPQAKPQGKPQGKNVPASQRRPAQKPSGKPQPKPQGKPAQKKPSKDVKKKQKKEVISEKDFIDTNKKEKSENKGNKANVISLVIVITIIVMSLALLFVTLLKMDKIHLNFHGKETTAVTSESEAIETTETTPSPTPTPTPSPTPSPVPLKDDAPDLSDMKIVIDPGHQEVTDEETELLASWVSTKKPRCTSGSTGVVSGVHEYEVTLDIALVLKDYLEQCGATVVLTRTENDVNLSNQERAEIATAANCDLFIRLHADGANDSATSGIRVYVPSSGNYSKSAVANGDILGQLLAEAEGLEFDQTVATQVYTGLNYASSVRSFQVCLGYLTNSDDEAVLTDPDMHYEIAAAIAQFCSEVK